MFKVHTATCRNFGVSSYRSIIELVGGYIYVMTGIIGCDGITDWGLGYIGLNRNWVILVQLGTELH